MIYLLARVNVAAGKNAEFSEIIGKHIAPAWERAGAKLIGSWETIIGNITEVVDLWQFESMTKYDEWGKAQSKDPAVREYLPKLMGTVVLGEQNSVLRPLPCSPMK